MIDWNKLDIFKNDNYQSITWHDIDDDIYNNHFINGQCKLEVYYMSEASKAIESQITMNIPCYPENISFNGNTNYAPASIIGRPGDISGYTGTSDITTHFSLQLHREIDIPGNTDNINKMSKDPININTDKNKIDLLVNLIMACNYPKRYQNGLYMPIVKYKFGDTEIIGKQTSFNIKWEGTKIGNSYMQCTIELGVTHIFDHIPYFNDIANLQTPRTLN